MTTPNLNADRDTLGLDKAPMTDGEVLRLARRAEWLASTGLDGDTFDGKLLSRLLVEFVEARRERDDLTRKLEEACAAEQRAAIRAGEWMQRVDEARRQVATAREAAFVEAIDLARAARDRALLAMLGAKNSHMRFAEGATHTSLDALVGELARAMHVGAGGEEG